MNPSPSLAPARSCGALQLLARKGVGLPVTGFAHSPDDTRDLINLVGGAPMIVKLTEAYAGCWRGAFAKPTRRQ